MKTTRGTCSAYKLTVVSNPISIGYTVYGENFSFEMAFNKMTLKTAIMAESIFTFFMN